MRASRIITVVDAHAEGDTGKVVAGGVPDVPGRTMLEKALHLEHHDDWLRCFLLNEPRGMAATCANLVLPPTRGAADMGFIIMESMGYPAMSGSNAMCTATVLLETGMVPMEETETRLVLEAPGGLVVVRARCRRGRCERVEIENVPAFASHLDTAIEVPGLGIDVAYGGVFFAIVDAAALGFGIAPDEARELVETGNKIKAAATEWIEVRHPEQPAIMAELFVLFAGPVRRDGRGRLASRNAVVAPPGWIDRCPTGTGTSARLAALHARGQIGTGEVLSHAGILGTRFEARVIGAARVGPHAAVRTAIASRAWITGLHHYILDPDDPFPEGFTLPDVWPG
jgi:proline racemase